MKGVKGGLSPVLGAHVKGPRQAEPGFNLFGGAHVKGRTRAGQGNTRGAVGTHNSLHDCLTFCQSLYLGEMGEEGPTTNRPCTQ